MTYEVFFTQFKADRLEVQLNKKEEEVLIYSHWGKEGAVYNHRKLNHKQYGMEFGTYNLDWFFYDNKKYMRAYITY